MLISSLLSDADTPPREVLGVGEQFLTDLERIPKAALKKEAVCPICNNPFLDGMYFYLEAEGWCWERGHGMVEADDVVLDPYPLVVRLPCHRSHLFDLECIAPWLKLNSTCPLDRKDLLGDRKAKAKEVEKAKEREKEDDEEVWDDMYA